MSSTFILCVRKGKKKFSESDLPNLYKFKDISFEKFEDTTEYETYSDSDEETKPPVIDAMRRYSAEEGLKMFLDAKSKITAGEKWGLPPDTLARISEEIDLAITDFTEPAKRHQQFHLAWCE